MRAQNYRVESICRVLTEHGVQVAPRTYRNWKTAPPSARTISDAYLTAALRDTVGEPEELYGRRKMYRHLRRKGHNAAACTIDRLMGDEGMSGVVRDKRHRTTIQGGKNSTRAPDLLDRDFTSEAPNRKWVTDFTYTRTWAGFVYVAFVIDCFSRAIVGWHASTVKDTAMVTTALKMALWRRDHGGHRVGSGLIHHSDAGSQYTSIAFAETLVLEGNCSIDWERRRRLRQCVGGEHNWVVQDRGGIEEKPIPERSAQDHRRCRVRHDGMGRLVQPTPTPQHPRLPHTRRIRGGLLQSRIGTPPGDVASVGAARNPGRFTPRGSWNSRSFPGAMVDVETERWAPRRFDRRSQLGTAETVVGAIAFARMLGTYNMLYVDGRVNL
jgi:putative transposase